MGKFGMEVFIALGYALFAVLGAFVKWLNENGKNGNFYLLLTEAATAAFGGLLIYCTYEWMGMDIRLAFAVSGVVGYLGIGGVRLFVNVFCKRLNLPLPDENSTGKQGETE